MENQLNTGTLDSLKKGETLLIDARKVNGDKIQLQFAELLNNADFISALTVLNKSDERFSSRPRRAWVTAEPADASELFGVNFGDDGEWYMGQTQGGNPAELMDLDILNPMYNDMRFRIQIVETTEGTQWQLDNIENSAKRRGRGGNFITSEGNYVFSNGNVILAKPEDEITHTYLEADSVAISEDSVPEKEEETTELNIL